MSYLIFKGIVMKSKDVLRLLGVTRQTLSKYVRDGKIRAELKHNNQFDYCEEDVFKLANKGVTRKSVIYARVSTSNQKKDLENQVRLLEEFCNKSGVIVSETYSEIASGMHYERKQFQLLLDEVMQNKIATVFVSYKDRLGRMSFDMMKKLFETFGTKIIVISELEDKKTTEQEFFEELVAILHSFSMKMYSKRRKNKLQILKQDVELESEILIESGDIN